MCGSTACAVACVAAEERGVGWRGLKRWARRSIAFRLILNPRCVTAAGRGIPAADELHVCYIAVGATKLALQFALFAVTCRPPKIFSKNISQQTTFTKNNARELLLSRHPPTGGALPASLCTSSPWSAAWIVRLYHSLRSTVHTVVQLGC